MGILMAQQIQFRRGTASEWVTANPILAQGEMGIELGTNLFKIGNGVDHWVDLPYGGLAGAGVPTGGTVDQALIKRSNADYDTMWEDINKSFVGLGNVENLSPADLPISTATQAALDAIDAELATQQTEIDGKQDADADLTAIAGLTTPGLLVKTGSGTAATRSIQGSSTINVSNGSGVGGDPAISVADGGISDINIATDAGISFSKMDTLTASKAAVTDPQGVIVASNTTATEIGYVSGVTSPIQAQLDAKQPGGSYITSLTGDVTGTGPGAAATTISNGAVTNAKVASGAAISYSKLNLANSIVNADVATGAAIAYSKLNLSSSIVNADVASGAAIAYSKLNLSNSIVNADIATGANIDLTKLAVLSSLSELYGFPQAGDTLMQALSRLAYSSSLQYNTISANAIIPTGSTWIREETTIDGTSELLLDGDATVSLI